MNVILTPVSGDVHEKFLYDLLAERKPYQNISHKEMPDYIDHVSFVRSEPHKAWYIVQHSLSSELVGSIYLGQSDNVGIHIKEIHQGRGFGACSLTLLMRAHSNIKEFRAHIAPNNSVSLCFFINMGFKFKRADLSINEDITQFVYTMINPYYDDLKESV